ncbi:hypothetical protein [Haliscomenobacter sp.]|uniref:hypothetical protein n=1 Tax=Haliscomenobacter sp. TaxID=2717303 RepID=UPI0035935653
MLEFCHRKTYLRFVELASSTLQAKDIVLLLTNSKFMNEADGKISPWEGAKIKKIDPTSKELWHRNKQVRDKVEKVKKYKKVNPSSLNQQFEV